jgi:hypothetical protein
MNERQCVRDNSCEIWFSENQINCEKGAKGRWRHNLVLDSKVRWTIYAGTSIEKIYLPFTPIKGKNGIHYLDLENITMLRNGKQRYRAIHSNHISCLCPQKEGLMTHVIVI